MPKINEITLYMLKIIKILLIFVLFNSSVLIAQNDEHGHDVTKEEAQKEHFEQSHEKKAEEEYELKNTIFHHIGNHNVYSILGTNIPLPAILYSPGKGWDVFLTSKFDIGHHGNGHKVVDGYVLSEGSIYQIADKSFPDGEFHIDKIERKTEKVDGKKKEVQYVTVDGKEYKLNPRSTWDGGMLGGGITSFYDFSITKNVVFMLLSALFLMWVFIKIANDYKNRKESAPKGLQSFFEPIVLFVRDEVARPFIGDKYNKYLPYLLSIFFFILVLNLFGQIPFLGSTNVTGNMSVTLALALVAFFVVNLSGKKTYWKHIFWMPGVPWWVKATILTPIEFLGLFIKPFTLMLRLFANISAGHMVVLVFISLIFIFGNAGESVSGSATGAVLAVPLTIFMMALELLVAFIQAFVFTMLVASYIGAAVEEHH